MLPILSQHFYRSLQEPLAYEAIEGLEHVDKVVAVDQSPLDVHRVRIPLLTRVYSLTFVPCSSICPKPRFAVTSPDASPSMCAADAVRFVREMAIRPSKCNFLPDVYVPCEACHGKRYNHETLEVRFKGKSIADVLDMTINQAVEFFENVPNILHKIKVLQEVGLGYIKLGQSSTTLSGGESQRVKLATELSKRDTGQTIYILDEPTTGLHFEDIRVLMEVLQKLVERGNTVIVIEHNLDVIKVADYLIDMGPEGGRGGGQLLYQGTPEGLVKSEKGYTWKFLREEMAESDSKP